MRRGDAEKVARPVVVAAAGALGVHPDAAWCVVASDDARMSQPPPAVALARLASIVALFEAGLPLVTASRAVGSGWRRQVGGSAASTVAAMATTLARTAPAVLAAARGAARKAVREMLPPSAEETLAAARSISAEAMAKAGVSAEMLAAAWDRRGAAVRRHVARTLAVNGHTRQNIADAMGWSPTAVDWWVDSKRGNSATVPHGTPRGSRGPRVSRDDAPKDNAVRASLTA